MKERKKKRKSQQTRLSVLQLVTITNTGPLQKHWAVTETSSRYRNAQPLQQHKADAETPNRYSNTKPSQKRRTVTETQSCFLVKSHHSVNESPLLRRVETSISRAGRTCARLNTTMLLALSLYCETFRSCYEGYRPTGRFRFVGTMLVCE